MFAESDEHYSAEHSEIYPTDKNVNLAVALVNVVVFGRSGSNCGLMASTDNRTVKQSQEYQA